MRPNGAWSENPEGRADTLAGNIVSNGLFSFLTGGIPSKSNMGFLRMLLCNGHCRINFYITSVSS